MIRTGALPTALVALLSTEADALSCGPVDPLRMLAYARGWPEPVAALHGRLTLDESRLPQEGPWRWPWQKEAGTVPAPPVPARFEGVRFGPEGAEPVTVDLTIEPSCLGDYCGAIYDGTYLIFARETRTGLAVEIGPCGGPAFSDPEPALLDTVAVCLAGGACPSTEP